MKLFWKQFITMMCFIILAFMLFGNILIHTSFQMTLSRETKRGIEEMEMFQYALLASLEGLPDDYQAIELAITEIAKSIQKNLENPQNMVTIYDEDKHVLYQNKKYKSKLIHKKQEQFSEIWQISQQNGKHYLEILFLVKGDFGTYYLEADRSIEYVYKEREQLYDSYKAVLFVISFVLAALSFLFSIRLTNPIRKLSYATRAFADGNYKSRVKKKGNDEVADLMADFNQMADQLENNIWEIQENARRQKEFTEAFSHELKTPLTSIIGYADMLRSRQLTEEDVTMSADYIFHQGKRLERLALKMLELTYLDKQEITLQKLSVKELVSYVETSTQKLLQEKGITLEVQVMDGMVYGDMDLLQSLFFNLIDNSRKACEKNGAILFSGKLLEGSYQFFVQDNGCGIPEEEIGKITEAFYMVDKSRARKEGGAGIGMALCQKIISLHQAEWEIQSKVGEGTRVTISFITKERQGKG